MSKKNRIFAAAIAVFIVCFMYISSFSASAYRLYEMDCKYYPDTHTVEFTGMLGAAYYEIRAYAPGEDIAYNTGTLMSTFTPDTASTGEEYYEVVLGGDHDGPLDTALRSLEAQAYYTIKVYAYGTYVPVKSFSVRMEGVNCTTEKTFDKVNNGSSYTVRFYDDGAYKADYGYILVTMGGVYIHNTDQVTKTVGDCYIDITVTNVTGALYIRCVADTTQTPVDLATPVLRKVGNTSVAWDSVEGATEYRVDGYYVATADYDKYSTGQLAPQLLHTYWTTDTTVDVASEFFGSLGYYFIEVTACYHTDEVQSMPSELLELDITQNMDFSSINPDVVIGESNPFVIVTGKGGGICKKPHIVDKNGDGYDDASFDAGVTYQTNSSGDSGVSDFFTKILGAITGSAIYVGSNVKIAGISLLTIAGILAVGVAIAILFSFKKGS